MKPDTKRVFNYLWRNAHRRVPSSELLRNLRMADYRSRVSEIRKFLKIDDVLAIESRRIPGRRTHYYRLVPRKELAA